MYALHFQSQPDLEIAFVGVQVPQAPVRSVHYPRQRPVQDHGDEDMMTTRPNVDPPPAESLCGSYTHSFGEH